MPANDEYRIVVISAELESGRDKYKLYINLYFDDIVIGGLEEDDIEFKVAIEKAYLEVRVTNGGYNIKLAPGTNTQKTVPKRLNMRWLKRQAGNVLGLR